MPHYWGCNQQVFLGMPSFSCPVHSSPTILPPACSERIEMAGHWLGLLRTFCGSTGPHSRATSPKEGLARHQVLLGFIVHSPVFQILTLMCLTSEDPCLPCLTGEWQEIVGEREGTLKKILRLVTEFKQWNTKPMELSWNHLWVFLLSKYVCRGNKWITLWMLGIASIILTGLDMSQGWGRWIGQVIGLWITFRKGI